MIVVTWLQRAHMVQEVRKTWSQLGPIELTVREGGLLVTEQGAKSEFNWSRYVRLRESKNHFLLSRSSDIYAIVPKRGFANQEDLDSFRQIATRGIARA